MPKNRWNTQEAKKLQGLNELVYRSNLLGMDRTICNWGGGNTSMKTVEKDFRGREVSIMWVKGSGSDLATAEAKNFTALRLDDVQPLIEREDMSDEEMVEYLTHCMLDSRHPRMSIETLLHAFLPFKHVDHTHPDAIISICCADNGREIADELFGKRYVWVPYIRPGFKLSKMIAEKVKENPHAELVLMEKHGLVTWGDTSEEAYMQTLKVIQEAEDYIVKKIEQAGHSLFGGKKYETLNKEGREDVAAQVMPIIRGLVSQERRMILHFDDGEEVLAFVNSKDAKELSQVGAACPDHLVHTRRVPLYLDWDPTSKTVKELIDLLREGISRYASEYKEYFSKYKNDGDTMFEPVPRVILVPGVGMITTGKSKKMAEVSAALYERAIAVMKGSTVLGRFTSLNAEESFNVEYWPLELYKLTLAPPEAEFSRQVVFITGGAGGIGSQTARRFIQEGGHVVLADLNVERAQQIATDLNRTAGEERAMAVHVDVTDEQLVQSGYREAILNFGGVDAIVNNAGLATSSPFDKTSLDEWNLNANVLSTGYFLVAREAFRHMKEQGIGGSMVFVGSKNSIYAGKNAAAYSTAKAAEVHLARCIAVEGGEYGIRVNSVLPDAVLEGSQIWNSGWRKERAEAYGIKPEELEDHYRRRTILNENVYPNDIADAILYFASSRSSKTTGSMITVDGGVAAAFTR